MGKGLNYKIPFGDFTSKIGQRSNPCYILLLNIYHIRNVQATDITSPKGKVPSTNIWCCAPYL